MLDTRRGIAREDRRKEGQQREKSRHADDGRREGDRQASAAPRLDYPQDRQDPEDDVRRGNLGSEESEKDEKGKESLSNRQRASEPGRASSISMTGMSDTIG